MNALHPSSAAPVDYGRLARIYRPLEYLAFGRSLEAARFCFLDRLGDRRHVLVFGEGDGRCLARLLRLYPALPVTCVDVSARLIRRAASRVGPAVRRRVRFIQADARAYAPPPATFDAVITQFFFDNLEALETGRVIERIRPALRPGACWLWADFHIPERGPLARWRARAWMALLYGFFGLTLGLTVRELPPAEDLIQAAGFAVAERRSFQHGLVRSTLLRLPGRRAAGVRPLTESAGDRGVNG